MLYREMNCIESFIAFPYSVIKQRTSVLEEMSLKVLLSM